MSKLFTLQTDTTLSCLQHHKLKLHHHHHHTPKNHFLKPSLLNSRKGFSKICCNIKEKENLAENGERIVSGLKIVVDDDDDDFGDVGNGKVLGFDNMDWPPWKNVPQRYKMIGTTSLAFVICNMDKVNLSIAIIPMSHQFGWSSSVAGLVQSSFFWGYAMSQLPGGWLSKIFGGRVILQFGVLAWSLATALVPLVAGFMPGLVLSRILVGIGEGVSPSAATDLIARLIPLEERSRAVSFVFGGLSVGSVLGLLLAPPLIESFGWESVFYMFGSFGIMWFLGFQFVAEDQPSTNSASLSRSQSNHKAKSWETSMEEFGTMEVFFPK
ncbi:phosphate transporter 4,5 [Artemisia annua]|uniref:Phosphate transporter 4,5 n=1 Tax=Artemisia annua TaxID=35608 RepID=A0A2U1L017_ARTAN|nr:phosphate transporter 4,5 [Artemisia annua]